MLDYRITSDTCIRYDRVVRMISLYNGWGEYYLGTAKEAVAMVTKFLITGVLMAVIDAAWLGFVANKFYKSQIGSLLLTKPNMAAAAAFYLIYVFGIILFILNPALEKASLQHALVYGAVFGFVCYATYDLTNLATLKGFSLKLVLVDLVWGAILTATVAGLSYVILSR